MMNEPLKVFYFNSRWNTFVFDEKLYSQWLSSFNEKHRDLPVAIVSIVGDARKRKSFLLNFFLRYLQRHDQEDWIGDLDEPLRGFSWRDDVERDTIGIALWPKPFVLTRKDGSKIVVILMDIQGFYDDHNDHDTIGQFFIISTIISSIQIYNQKGNIQSNDFTILSKFSEYANKVGLENGVDGFQRLLFVIRILSKSRELEFGFKGGNNYLKYKKEIHLDKFCSPWANLEKCYSDIGFFLLPSIGDRAEDLDFNGKISKLKPEFVKALRELVPSLLAPDRIVTKSIGGEEAQCWQVLNIFKKLAESKAMESIKKSQTIKDISQIIKASYHSKTLFHFTFQEKGFLFAQELSIRMYDNEIQLVHGEKMLASSARDDLFVYFGSLLNNYIKINEASINRPSKIDWVKMIGVGAFVAFTVASLVLLKRP
ncbi:atlastin-2-like [Panonychus citri]|uniref:atlastin-2-like n=1 Tax=Panonychus citri TaxID=50023 RepID=UPI0023079147|nr:atlastin-2-like [Panonychus citri]